MRRIEDNHTVLRKSTAYRGQAQRIRDRRGGLKTKNPIIPCQRDKTWRPYRWVQSKCFVKREDICLHTFWLLFKSKTKERFHLFWQPMFLLLAHYVRFPGSFDTKPFRYKLKSIWYDIPRASTKTLKKSLDQNLTSKKFPGGGGKFGKRCAAEAFKHRSCLRQKLLISPPCLRQETLLSDPDVFVLHTELSSFSH